MKFTLSTMLVAAGLTLGLSGVAVANSTDETSSDSRATEAREGHEAHTDGVGAARGDAQITSKIVDAFTEFAGSPENAASLVAGLRSGSEITLAGADTGGTDTSGRNAASKSPTTSPTTTTFTSPTGPMSNGNVYLSLALAKDQLTGLGIDNPTPQQIAAALNGGTISTGTLGTVELQGVLQLRAEGLGWGRIAQAQGTKLGWVMGELKSANAMHFVSVASHAAGGATESETAHSDSGRGIHNGLGGNAASGHAYGDGQSEGHGVIAATGASAGGAFAAAGIVNAGGGGQSNAAAAAGVLGGSTAGFGHAAVAAAASNTPGAGVVSAAGGGDHGHAYGHGHEHGHGYGHGR